MVPTRHAMIHVVRFEGGGEGPTLVMLHGLGADCLSFTSLIFRLRPHFREIIIPDLPGHGWSADVEGLDPETLMQALTDALDAVLDGPAAVVGTSLGGMCAARFAATRPDLVESLMLIAPGGAQLSDAEFEALLQNFEMRRRADAVDFIDRCFVQTPWAVRRVLAAAVRRRMMDPRLQRVMARFGPRDMLRGGELASIRAPTLLVWGDEERLLPESVLEFFKAHLPAGARVERWSRFGHAGFLEQPRVIAQRIVGFSRDGAMASWGPQRLPWASVGATLASSP